MNSYVEVRVFDRWNPYADRFVRWAWLRQVRPLWGVRHPPCLARAGLAADRVDQVILGNVLSAGLGQNVARQAAIGSGIPVSTGALTVNRVCGSGLAAVILASQALQCGDWRRPSLRAARRICPKPRICSPRRAYGYRMGHGEIIDSMVRDGLWDVYHDRHMGSCGDQCAERCGFSGKLRMTLPWPVISAPGGTAAGLVR